MGLKIKAASIALAGALFILFNTNISAQITTGELGGAEPVLNAIQTAVPFLTIAPDSRSGAMGDVGAATTPDVNSQHWNIGKYAFVDSKGGFAISYTPWLRNLIPDINLAYLTGFFRVDEQQVISTSLRYFSLGNITFTNIDGSFAGQHNPNEFAVDAGYSRLFTDNFSGGIAFRFIRSDLTSGQQTSDGQATRAGISFAADLGFYYQNQVNIGSSDGEWAAGISLTNMGTPISYSVDADKTPIPTNMRIGGRFSYNIDEYNTISFNMDLNKLLVPSPPAFNDSIYAETGELVVERGKETPGSTVLGMVQSFYDAPGVLRNNGNYSTLVEELNEISYSAGVEYWYRSQFALRTGYFHEHSTKGNRKYFTLGVGLQLNVFALDFAYLVPTNGQNSPLANTLRFTLSFNFADLDL
ncbi:MAG: type IX secretion system outer membrane channel protein PorV [Bacteroidales bacterium]|nr:type IX secretion system outer membrane channel protein PorV [Bacteroidales bacterium]